MTFRIKKHGIWNKPYWKDELKCKKKLLNTNTQVYVDLDEMFFKDILRDELDVPDYTINAKNINKEFGFTDNGMKIPEDCIKHIVNYYKWRKELFEKICKLLLNNGAEVLLKNADCDELTFRYYIPAKYNNFSTEEANYTGGQVEAYLEVAIYR